MKMNTHGITQDHLLLQLFRNWQKTRDTDFFGEWFNKTLKNNRVIGNK